MDSTLVRELQWIATHLSGLVAAFVTLVAVLFLRRLLPASQRNKGKLTLVFLGLSLILHLIAIGLNETIFASGYNAVKFVAVIIQAFAMTGAVRLLLFDILLSRTRVQVPATLQDLLQAAAFAVIFFGVMRSAGVNLLSIVTTSAVLTAVIGLALQSTIANLFAGLSLQLDRTIGVGDWLKVGDHVGRIRQIKWRSTFIVTRDGDQLIIPNGELLKGEIMNFSKPTPDHRIWLKIGFHYRHPPNDVKKILIEAARGVTGVLPNPAPDVVVDDFGESAVVYGLRYWITDIGREDVIEGEVRTRIWYAAQRARLEIPFPIRNVYMTQVTDEQLTREQEMEFLERLAALSRIDLFAPLEPHDRETLAKGMRQVSFARGEEIIRQGDPGDSLYLIHEGQVAVRLNVEGVEREVATLDAGKFFGEMSLLTGEPRRATCAAKNDVQCYVVDQRAFRLILDAKPRIAEEISTLLGTRQSALDAEREGLSNEARARRAADASSRVLTKIRDFFHLG